MRFCREYDIYKITQSWDFCKNNDVSKVKKSFEDGVAIHLSNERDLFYAIKGGNYEVTKWLVEVGKCNINIKSSGLLLRDAVIAGNE